MYPDHKSELKRRVLQAAEAALVRDSRCSQGILVERAGLEKAEQECAADAGERATARARGATLRCEQDRELVAGMTRQIATLFPGCPPRDAAAIAEYIAVRGSGRIGRTAAGRSLEESALAAAVAAAVRHKHTGYDMLLAAGLGRPLARQQVADQVQAILAAWRQ